MNMKVTALTIALQILYVYPCIVEGYLTGENGGKRPPAGLNDADINGLSQELNDGDNMALELVDSYRRAGKNGDVRLPPPGLNHDGLNGLNQGLNDGDNMALELVDSYRRTGKNSDVRPPPPGFNDADVNGLSQGFLGNDDIAMKIRDDYRKNVKKDIDQPQPLNNVPNRAYETSLPKQDAGRDQGFSDEDDMGLKVDDSQNPSYELKKQARFLPFFHRGEIPLREFRVSPRRFDDQRESFDGPPKP